MTARVWQSQDFRSCSTEGRMLFIWAISPPRAGVLGVFPATLSDLDDALGAPLFDTPAERSERAMGALHELWEKQMLVYDDQWAWVVNRLRYALDDAGDGRRRETLAKAADELSRVPSMRIKEWVSQKYGL